MCIITMGLFHPEDRHKSQCEKVAFEYSHIELCLLSYPPNKFVCKLLLHYLALVRKTLFNNRDTKNQFIQKKFLVQQVNGAFFFFWDIYWFNYVWKFIIELSAIIVFLEEYYSGPLLNSYGRNWRIGGYSIHRKRRSGFQRRLKPFAVHFIYSSFRF